MKDEIKQVAETILSHPKISSALTLFAVKFNNLWVEWGNPFFDAITTIAGFVLIVVMILYHNENRKKIKKENKEK